MDERKLVRKAEREPWNRLNSILEDADWIASFCKSWAADLPIVPNLRCGLWYVPHASSDAYFKSTDGHALEWNFSLKRYNLKLLNIIQEHNGCVLVDSTRRGKSMPDAFSKTIPIWCAVLNAASQRRHGQPATTSIHLPEKVVSPSEQEQIVEKIDQWAEALLSSELFIPVLRKPLRPIFVTRSGQDEAVNQLKNRLELYYYPLVLVSASQMVPTPGLDPLHSPITKTALDLPKETEFLRTQSRYIYVQGSGDDEEMWSLHLTPSLFWKPSNLQRILGIGEGGKRLEATITLIVEESKANSFGLDGTSDVQVGDFDVFLGTRAISHTFTQSEQELYSLIVQADATPIEQERDKEEESSRILCLKISSGKRGLGAFRQSLPRVIVSELRGIKLLRSTSIHRPYTSYLIESRSPGTSW